jgi:hypothetical protein
MKTLISCACMFMVFFCTHNTEAYHINIINELYYCSASASAGGDSHSNAGVFSASTQAYDSLWLGLNPPVLYEDSASAKSSITTSHTINSLNYSSHIILDAKGTDAVGNAEAHAEALGNIEFMVVMDPTDVNSIVQANFMSGSSVDEATGPYVPYFISNLNGSDIPEGSHSLPLTVNELNILKLDFYHSTTSENMNQHADMSGGFQLEVPYAPAPLPSSVMFLGSGLIVVALGCKKKKARHTC